MRNMQFNKDTISRLAFVNDLPDEEMTCPERCLWYALRDVYRKFAAGDLTKEQGDEEKRKAVKQFNADSQKLDLAEQILRRDSEMWREIETACRAFRLDRSLENADAFVSAVYGVKMKKEGTGV